MHWKHDIWYHTRTTYDVTIWSHTGILTRGIRQDQVAAFFGHHPKVTKSDKIVESHQELTAAIHKQTTDTPIYKTEVVRQLV